jgi:hypothetical protein
MQTRGQMLPLRVTLYYPDEFLSFPALRLAVNNRILFHVLLYVRASSVNIALDSQG